MIRLDAWLTLPDGENVLCGELAFSDPDTRGSYRSAFRYTDAYLAHPQAFSLDPVALPLGKGEWEAERLTSPLMIFEDALPDDWGRKLLIRRAALPRAQQGLPHLLRALGNSGMGALAFLQPGASWQPRQPHDYDLRELHHAVQQYELGRHDDVGIVALLHAGGSPGGARPKALIRDADGEWLAKFPSVKDQVDMVGLEAATLELGRQAGLAVPHSRIEHLGENRRVLLVKRFDLTPEGGRRHMMSFQTALAASGWYVVGYKDMLAWIRKHGSRPGGDAPALFRWMVFNALVKNTDDHLKNFWLLGGPDGYELSPSFDLLPNVNDNLEHVLNFDLNPTIKREELADLGRKWGIARSKAIVEEVMDAMPQYASIAERFGVPEQDIARFCKV
jgi:serine/threonine-protein kinase HipA